MGWPDFGGYWRPVPTTSPASELASRSRSVPEDWVEQKHLGRTTGSAAAALLDVGLTEKMADDIYYLTSLAKFDDRFVIPAAHREEAIEMMEFTGDNKGSAGFGFKGGSAERGL